MLGVLVAPGGADEPDRRHLVAAVDLAPGDTIDPTMVQPVAMGLPPPVARHALTEVGDVADLTARVAVPAGAVLHAGQFRADPIDAAGGPEVTISVPVRRALGGRLATGDALDVIATYGSGTEGFSAVVAAGAIVTEVAPVDDALGVEPTVTVTVRLGPRDDVLAVVHAAHADALSLVLDTDEGAAAGAAFRPTPPAPTDRP